MKNMSHYTFIYIRIDFYFVFKIILWNTIVKWIKVVLKFQNYTLFRRGFPPENYEKNIQQNSRSSLACCVTLAGHPFSHLSLIDWLINLSRSGSQLKTSRGDWGVKGAPGRVYR